MSRYPPNTEHVRLLPKSEGDALFKRMVAVWGVDRHYWWPLSEPRPPHAEAFEEFYFEQEFGYTALRRILSEHGVSRVVEFSEDDEAYAIDVGAFERRCVLECMWTSDRCDWIVYVSHEGSVTIAGERLLPAVKAAWPGWQERIWRGISIRDETKGLV